MKTHLLKVTTLTVLISISTLLTAQTWAPIFTPGSATTGTATISNTSLDDVSFYDDNNGIVSLGYSYYLTTDGGATWSEDKNFSPFPLMYGAHYSAPQTIFIGGGSTIFKSTDNGTSFTAQATPTPALTIRDIKVVGNFGVLVDQSCRAAYSNDGGTTWSVISNTLLCNNLSRLNIVDVIDANNAIIAGNNGYIFKTTNSGNTWSAIITPTVTTSSDDIFGADFITPTEGYIVKGGKVFKTTDGGTSWSDLTSGFSAIPNFINHDLNGGVCVIDANTVYIGGEGYIYKSTNAGAVFNIDFTNTTNCNTCTFLNIEKSGNSIFASLPYGGSISKVYKRDMNAVGLIEADNKLSFTLYPNPINQLIHIQGINFNETVSVKIISVDGKLMQDIKTTSSTIDATELNSGMYFIELKNKDGKTGVAKFIKE